MEFMESADMFRFYLDSVRKYKILSKTEQASLSDRARRGDSEAFNALINSNLLLVVSIAKKYYGRGIPVMDLIQEGNMGLIMAARRYKSSFNTRFSTYAYLWIQQYILRFIQNKVPMIKVPSRKSELAGQYRVSSIDSPVTADGSLTVADMLEDNRSNPEHIFMKKMKCGEALSLLEILSEKEIDVLQCRYSFEGQKTKTLREVGALLGVTAETVRQTERRAIRRLRKVYMSAA